MKKFSLLLSSLMMLNFADAQILERHQWQDRVILLFTSSLEQGDYKHQSHVLTEKQDEVTDRGLKMYTLLPGGGRKPGGGALSAAQSEALYRLYGVTPGTGFTFVLIGKDGGEKLRQNEPVSPKALFGLIDSMPMRKAEMRRKRRAEDKKN